MSKVTEQQIVELTNSMIQDIFRGRLSISGVSKSEIKGMLRKDLEKLVRKIVDQAVKNREEMEK